MRIFLVRHGESLGNVDKQVHCTMADHAIPLSERGYDQAVAAGHRIDQCLRGGSIGTIRILSKPYIRLWTSPYRRTRQTAAAIRNNCHWVTDSREHILLCEQQFGLFDGVPDEDLPTRYPAEHAHYKKQQDWGGRFWARMPMGESRFDVATRVHQAFGTFHRDRDRHGIENIIVVCHGVTLRAFIMMWFHHDPEWFEQEPNPGNCAVRLIEQGQDRGYIFNGFDRAGEAQ